MTWVDKEEKKDLRFILREMHHILLTGKRGRETGLRPVIKEEGATTLRDVSKKKTTSSSI